MRSIRGAWERLGREVRAEREERMLEMWKEESGGRGGGV